LYLFDAAVERSKNKKNKIKRKQETIWNFT
jgi:hypothetical protein